MPDLPQFIPADSPDANALQTAPATAPAPDFIPVGSPAESNLTPSAVASPAAPTPATPAFIPADATPVLKTKAQHLFDLAPGNIVDEYRADLKADPSLDSTPYLLAYSARSREGMGWTGYADRSGAPDTPLYKKIPAIGQSLVEGFLSHASELEKAQFGYDPTTERSWTNLLSGGLLDRAHGLRKLSPEERTQANINFSQGTGLAMLRDANSLRQFATNVSNQLFPSEKDDKYRTQFAIDVAAKDAENDLAAKRLAIEPSGDLGFATKPADLLIPGAANQKVPLPDPATVESVASSPIADPAFLVPALGELGGAEKLAALSTSAGEKSVAAKIIEKTVSAPLKLAADAAAKTRNILDASPVARATLATGVALGAGVDSPMGLLTAAALGGEKAGKIAGSVLAKTSDVLNSSAGPMSQFASRAFSTLSNEGKAIVLGQAANIPWLYGSDNSDQFENMFLVGLYGHAFGKGVQAVNSLNFWAPASRGNLAAERLPVKPYGIDDAMDAAHTSAMQTSDNVGNNVVQGLRNYFGNRRELYVMSPADIEASLNSLQSQGAKLPPSISTPENIKATAQQNGVVVPVEMPDGTKRTLGFVALRQGIPGLGAGHEVGHLIESIASPEEISPIYDAIREAYQPAGIAAAKKRYEQQATTSGQPHQDMSEPQVVSELFAENASAVLNAIPIGEFGPEPKTGWKGAGRDIYALTERFLNKVGAKVPSIEGGTAGPKTGLGYDPSAPVGRLIENLLEAKRLDKTTFAPEDISDLPRTDDAISGVREIVPEAAFKKGDPLGDVKKPDGTVLGTDAKISDVLGTNSDNKQYYEIEYTDPADGKRKAGNVSEDFLKQPVKAGAEPKPQTTTSKGPPHPVTTETPEGAVPAPGTKVPATPEEIATKKTVRPEVEETPAPLKNVRATPAQQETFARKATPDVQRANTSLIAANEAKPRHERQAFETDYYSAKSDTFAPDALVRKEQRRLADIAETEAKKTGKPNPLRKIYSKVFVPYKYLDGGANGTPRVFGFSLDKFVQNADILRGWLRESVTSQNPLVPLRQRIESPNFVETVRKYLDNQSHGYAGNGQKLVRPADTKPGTVTPEDKNFSPSKISDDEMRTIGLLMGFPKPKSASPGNHYFAKFARENGIDPTINNAGVEETNPLREQLTKAGFNPALLNSAVENLPIANFTTPLKSRPDLHFPAGDTAFTQAGFMPSVREQGNNTTRDIALRYMRANGNEQEQHSTHAPIDEPLVRRIADFYDEVKSDPKAPEVQTAYKALADETLAQYGAMKKAGIQIEPYVGKGEPYKNSAEMMQDVRDNKHLYFPKTEGFEFGPRGEFNAYLAHSRMFSDEAKPALAAETLAQNAWVNFGKHLRRDDDSLPQKGDPDFKPLASRPFAEQKNFVVPKNLIDAADKSASFMPAMVEDMSGLTKERLEELKKNPSIVWHGSGSGDLRGGSHGLHVGTFAAAKDALEARIGRPAEGEWDGTREYGKTLLAGAERMSDARTGFNVDLPEKDFYPTEPPRISSTDARKSVIGEMSMKPSITPFRITGKMSNSPSNPHGDWAANGRMRGLISRGKAKSGYYYSNISEDAGSISAVLPNGGHLDQVHFMPVQHKGEPLEHSLGEKTLRLVHYGSSGVSKLDPARFGRSGITPQSELAGSPRTYFYEKGKENKSDPAVHRPNQYEAAVSGSRIYDGDTDELGYAGMINRWKADELLQKKGYVGIARTGTIGKTKYRQIELYKPTKVEQVTPPNYASYMPRATEAQEKAFPNSKVRDAEGNLQPVFHGTYSDFRKFKIGGLGFDFGAHFGTSKQADARIGHPLAELTGGEVSAENAWDAYPEIRETTAPRARGALETLADGARHIPVFLNLENPLRMRDVGPWGDPGEVYDAIPEKIRNALSDDVHGEVQKFEKFIDGYKGQLHTPKDVLRYNSEKNAKSKIGLAAIKAGLEKAGYDGIVYKNEFENSSGADRSDSYIAFKNSQIMPAFAHDGEARWMPEVGTPEAKSPGKLAVLHVSEDDKK